MNNKFKINLGFANLAKTVVLNLDYENNKAVLNNKSYKMDVRGFMDKLATIVSSWEEVMINNSILDGISYHVYLQRNGELKKYVGRNKFPAKIC